MSLCFVDLFEIGVIRDGFDPLLERDHFIVARHDCNDAELQTLRPMHRTYRYTVLYRLDAFIQNLKRKPSVANRCARSVQLLRRPHEHHDFTSTYAFVSAFLQPCSDSLTFFLISLENAYCWRLSIKSRDCSPSILDVAIDIGDFGIQQTIRLRPDLMGRSIVEFESPRFPPDIDSQCFLGKWRLENPLSQITCKKEAIGPLIAPCRKKTQLGDTDVLRFIHDCEIKRRLPKTFESPNAGSDTRKAS